MKLGAILLMTLLVLFLLARFLGACRNGSRERASRCSCEKARVSPDLQIMEPRGSYCGMFLELKAGKGAPSPDQKIMLALLRNNGYYATYARGFDEATAEIARYVGLPKAERRSA